MHAGKFDPIGHSIILEGTRLVCSIRNLDSQQGSSNNWLEVMEKFKQIILMPELSKSIEKTKKTD